MKRLAFIYLVLCACFQTYLSSQSCLPEGITFNTQWQIDNFQTNYPNCTEIEGDVIIDGIDITNLNGLDVVTFIGGDLLIWNNSLISLNGLHNLTNVSGDFELFSTGLINLSGLNTLTNIDGDLRFLWNPNLNDLTGLEYLTTIGGDLDIHLGCYGMTSLTGLESLNSIGGNLHIDNNYSLGSLSALSNLTSIGGYLQISGNHGLTNLEGLESIDAASITDLRIFGNIWLSTCEVQSISDYLSSPNGTVDIHSNASGCQSPPEVATACGIILPCLPFGNYYLFTQSDIDNFQINYPNCTQIEGNVTIHGNNISNLNGLSEITAIDGDLLINNNDILQELTGLNALTAVGGNVQIDENPTLLNLTGLGGLNEIGGGLYIGAGFMIGGFGNPLLTDLMGLENVTSIGAGVRVRYNAALTSLAGINNIDANTITYISIFDNPNLSKCEVESICEYVASPTGIIEIHDNAPGCNSIEEVELACETISVEEIEFRAENFEISCFPNPFNSVATIQVILPESGFVILYITDITGIKVHTLNPGFLNAGDHAFDWNANRLPAGIYYCVLKTNTTIHTTKLIKLE